MTADVEIVRSPESLAGFLPEWDEFVRAHAGTHSFYQNPAMAEIVLAGEGVLPRVIVVRRAGRLACVAPLALRKTRYPLRFGLLTLARVPLRLLKLLGDDFVIGRDADAGACREAVIRALRAMNGEFDLLLLERLPLRGRLAEYLQSPALRAEGFECILPAADPQHVWQLKLPASFDAYAAAMRHKTRYNLQRARRKLWEAAKDAQVLKVEKPEDVPAFLRHVDSVFRCSWQARRGAAGKRDGAADVRRLQRVAGHGWLRSYVLLCADRPVAFAVGYQYAGTFTLEEIGYDPDWARFSPGSVLNFLIVEDLFQSDNRPVLLDFGFGENVYKHVLGNECYEAGQAYVVPRTRRRARWVMRGQKVLAFLYAQARRAFAPTRWGRRMRRMLRRRNPAHGPPDA
ncbi:MAG: GNAT family N-acetyltransferase [Kiritimatiellae bacterium]|nr:GNAT family N-acetyltransferase [Kiritimatiellia bacterium]